MKFLFFCAVLFAFSSCRENSEGGLNDDIPLFYGKVTYRITLDSEDSALLQNIAPFMANKVEVYFGDDKFRMIEYGGASHGNIFIYKNRQEAWQLDTANKIAYLSDFSDLNEPSEDLMDMMPDHFAPSLQQLNEIDTVLGVPCRKYKVTRSGFIPAADEAYLWVTDQFAFPSSRYDVESEINRVIVPLPLYIGLEGGAVLKLRVSNKNYSATYEVTELNKNSDDSVFNIPEGYSKK